MVDLKKAYIAQAICILNHALDKRVRYRQEEAESIFGTAFQTQSQQTNVPDDFEPSAPRLIFQNGHRQLMLSQSLVQLVLGFENSEKTLDQQMDIIFKNIADIHSRAQKFQPSGWTGEVGVIFVVNVPSDLGRDALSENVFSRFIKLERLYDTASVALKVGFKTKENLYLNFEIDVYELRKTIFDPGLQPKAIDISAIPVHEMGYSFKVDVNNKPRLTGGMDTRSELVAVTSEIKQFIDGKFQEWIKFDALGNAQK